MFLSLLIILVLKKSKMNKYVEIYDGLILNLEQLKIKTITKDDGTDVYRMLFNRSGGG